MILRFLPRSLKDFKRHPWLHALSVGTVTISLIILGIFFLCYTNVLALTDRVDPKAIGTAYLIDGLNELEIEALKNRIQSLPTVAGVSFKAKNSILKELSGAYGGQNLEQEHLSDLFPDVLEVQLRQDLKPASIEAIGMDISKMPEVVETDFSPGWFSQIDSLRNAFNIVGLVLMVGLLLGCSFLIANFMGMRHQSRRKDIEIVQLMGASRSYVFLPFLIESLLEGIIGILFSLCFLAVIQLLASSALITNWMEMIGMGEVLFLTPYQILGIIGIGIMMSILGSVTIFLRFDPKP